MTKPLSEHLLGEVLSVDLGEWCQGPWTQDLVEGSGDESDHFVVKDRDGQIVARVPAWAGSIALFLAVARDAVPALAAEVQRLRAEVRLLRDERNTFASAVSFARQWTPDVPVSLDQGVATILATLPPGGESAAQPTEFVAPAGER